jgi:hypothetical protein
VLGISPMPSPARFPPLVVALLLCGSPAWAAEPATAAPSLLHRSSLAAVLAQRGALQLTPDQVKLLEQADARLAREQESAKAAQAHPEDAPPGNPGGMPSGKPPGGSGAGPASGGPGGMGGGKSRPSTPPRRSGPSPAELLEQQLDALDTQAFLTVVETLPEPQREKAIEVASRHREQVFEQREREKSR